MKSLASGLRCCALLLLLLPWSLAAHAQETAPAEPPAADPPQSTGSKALDTLDSIWNNRFGKFILDSRLRYSHADIDGQGASNGVTMRTRFGFQTKSWEGFSGLVEGAGSFHFNRDDFWDGVGPNSSGKSIVSDPEFIDVNRAWARYEYEPLGTATKVGRQRWKLDDDRFIGNVGWRQNEQTIDSVRLDTSGGLDNLRATYGYLWRVKRIWGNRSNPDGRKNFNSNSHVINVNYKFFPELAVSFFNYYLNLNNSDPDSTNSLGYRATGKVGIVEDWDVKYQHSFAWQTEAGQNPNDYDAYYYMFEAEPGWEKLGRIGLGYEVLGTDDGDTQFRTPLATAHKFNGFADAFLDNGGPKGLRDLYLTISPKLPFGIKAKLFYHWFWNDDGGGQLGQEFDFVISKQINEHINVLTKYAWFDGRTDGPADRIRLTLQTEIKF